MADPRRASTGQAPRMVMGPPETPGRAMQASPNLFPSLQFSPDMFSNAAFGPATAPAYPQQRLFWDPNMGSMDAVAGLPPYQDPFAFSQPDFNQSFHSTSTVMQSFDPTTQVPELQPYDLPPMSRPMNTSYVDGAAFPAPFSTSPRMAPPREENPSMFLSSPARRFTNNDHQQPMQNTIARDKPAYHHQIEESRREREAKRQRKGDVKHPSVTRSVMEALRRPVSPVKDSRPGLKRSLTHSGVAANKPHLRNQSHVSFLDNVSNASGSTNHSRRTGRSSPLKSLAASINRSQASSRNSKRTSMSLSIDEHGVARTVVTKVPDEMDLDTEEDSSDSEISFRDESDFHVMRSQQNSFAYPEDDDMHDNAPLPSSRLHGHSKNSSYSTMTSRSSALHSSQTSSSYSTTKARGPNRPGQRKSIMLEPMREDEGDAQQALRAIIQDRSRSASTQDGSMSSMQFNSSPPLHQNQYATFNVSPTTITDPDLATPSTDRDSSVSNGSTRCVCNSSEPSNLMIQWCVQSFPT